MRLLIDSFWRAAAYCLHPRVVLLSVLPVLLMAGTALGLAYLYWDSAVDAVRLWLESWSLVQALLAWLESVGAGQLRSVFAPLLVLALVTPVLVVLALLVVGLSMTPAMVSLVAQRRFGHLQRQGQAGFWGSVAWSLGSTVLALLMLAASMPLWLLPPLVLLFPPLIWGWLTYRVFAFDALADHATTAERNALLAQHRLTLLVMGVACGFLGAAPSVLWASGAFFVALAPLLVPAAVWVYALVFAFSSLWFAHFLLAALDEHRRRQAPATLVPDAAAQAVQDAPAADLFPSGAPAAPAMTTAGPAAPAVADDITDVTPRALH